jgi:mannose-6-phosphate isomerase-like protein (cupin superfamily)
MSDVLGPGDGRTYEMGRITAVFKSETPDHSISEWWLEPGTDGPGLHSHDEDDIFYVLAGTMRVVVGDEVFDAGPGTFVRAAGGVLHDFSNPGTERAGMLNVSTPGGFEAHMPPIADWFRNRDGYTEP